MRVRLVFATRNEGKIREFRTLMQDLPIDVVPVSKLPDIPTVEETGTTFEENARLKAATVSVASGLPALAEDSGLEVDALDGAPGVHSARFSGSDDAGNNRKVLELLQEVPEERRSCRYRCVVILAEGKRVVLSADGSCEGRIAESPAGEGGFGYDPIFFVPSEGRTTAEMTLEEKNRMSHRGRAFRALRDKLVEWLATRGGRL